MPPSTRQACDACRRRKIKCNGQQPCLNCGRAGLSCTFQLIPRKKGRQGQRANILSELRGSQATQTPSDAQVQETSPVRSSQPQGTSPGLSPHANRSSRLASDFCPTPALLSVDMIHACTDLFLTRLQSTVPILDREMIEQEVLLMNDSIQAYCFIVCFCAYVIISTGAAVNHSYAAIDGSTLAADIGYGQDLIDEALETRRYMDPAATPSCRTIMISFFLYGSHVGLGSQRRAWFFLRETTTLYTSGPLSVEPETKINHASVTVRLFWLLLISERSHAIRRRRPVTLQVTPDSPVLDDRATDGTPASGFVYLISLFRPFDEHFFALWNRTHTACTEDSLIILEAQIQHAVPLVLQLPDDQLANLRVSQQWLRTVIWELFTLLGFLSTGSAHECMTFQYPLRIARDLTFATWKLPQQSMEIHGVGMTEKIFDVACALTDVLTYIPSTLTPVSGFELGPKDYLQHFCSLMSKLPGGPNKFIPLLLAKVGQLLPTMLTPISQHLQIPVPAALTPDSRYMYDEEVRGYLNGGLGGTGPEQREGTSG